MSAKAHNKANQRQSKHNAPKYKLYKDRERREFNQVRKLTKHVKRFPNDTAAQKSLTKMVDKYPTFARQCDSRRVLNTVTK